MHATRCVVYDQLHKVGDALGLRDAGYFAIESLRIEKGYRAWGPDLTADYTPLEAGLSFAVDLTKEDFIGKRALVEQRASGALKRRMVLFRIDEEEAFPHGMSENRLLG
jgi:glycine cleavage system aminomethyltransferase T